MDSYQVLKSIHKVGHPISGVILDYKKTYYQNNLVACNVEVQTDSAFKTILPLDYLFFTKEGFNENFDDSLIPKRGSKLDFVIRNHVGNTLYISGKPSELESSRIREFKDFYKFIEKIEENQVRTGIIEKVMPFGLFVNLSYPYLGLIDIGRISFNKGVKLEYDNLKHFKVGDSIKCIISYFRFYNKQIGLDWIKE